MPVNLHKGQTLSLAKATSSFSTVTIGLGWDVAPRKGGFFAKLFAAPQPEYDLDAVAFLLGADGKITTAGDPKTLQGSDVVFFNHMRHPSGKIWLTGDNRTGAGEGDDEQIVVKLSEIPPQYARIVICVIIYEGRQKGQTFGGIENAFVRAVDAKGQEMAKFSLGASPATADMCSLVFAELVRSGDDWEFKAVGEPHRTDNLIDHLRRYV